MKNMRRIKRMSRSRKRKVPAMNLVSLMDVFTILLFFLLVNSSSSTEVLPSPDVLELPDSIAEQKPEQTIVVMVTQEKVLIDGEIVADIAEVLQQNESIIDGVRSVLAAKSAQVISRSDSANERRREVTIMGDREIPFSLLKKVMASCTAAGFQKISLAVVQRASQNGG